MTESSYAYAFGRVKALEVDLLTTAQIKRMTDAHTAEDALKVLSESPYSTHLPERPDIPEIEKAILRELEETYEIVKKISPNKEVIGLFELKYDIHNIKILLKSEISKKQLSHLLIPLGREGIDNLRAAFDGDLKAVSSDIADIIENSRQLYEETGDFQRVQFFLDREHTNLIERGFKGHSFLEEFFTIRIDLENIRNFMRVQKTAIEFEEVFLPRGNFDIKFFEEIRDQPAEFFVEKTRNKDFANVVSEGLKAYQMTGSLAKYEKLAEDFLMQYMKKAKLYSLSIEPLVGYLFAKEREASLVRQILISKIKGIDIQDKVGEPYG